MVPIQKIYGAKRKINIKAHSDTLNIRSSNANRSGNNFRTYLHLPIHLLKLDTLKQKSATEINQQRFFIKTIGLRSSDFGL